MQVHIQQNIDINSRNSFDHNGPILDTRYALSEFIPIARYTNRKMATTATATPQQQIRKIDVPSTAAPILTDQKIVYDVVKEEDTEEILTLLKTFFFKDEPLNTFLNLGECEELAIYSTKSIREGCSFKAVNENGEIIGVFLNGIIKKPSADGPEGHGLAANCKHEKFSKILSLMDFIDSKFSIFKCYPNINQYLDGKILSVNENYRGMGIAGQLTSKTIEYMKENNIPVFHVLCTSHYSARVCEKLEFEEVYRLPYIDYVVNGENPLLPAEPHKIVKILTKIIK